MSTNTLARLWQSRGFVPDRLLFFTYVLNFRDFHDQVLRRLIDNAGGRVLSVDVVASRVDLDEESDCFDFRYIAPLKNRFRLFRVDSVPLAHAKGIVARDTRTGKVLSGFGSANLTPGGWRRNIESWHWDKGQSASAILDMSEGLERRNGLKSGVTAGWRTSFGTGRPRHSAAALGVPEAPNLGAVLKRLVTFVRRPRIVRVASPYFDAHSAELFGRIAHETGRCRLEIWSDRSGGLAQPTHWRILSDCLRRLQTSFDEVVVLAPPREVPWHAKVIELDDAQGRVARVFGSCNFTGAGWGVPASRNVELMAVEFGKQSLRDLLGARNIKMTAVGVSERRRLAMREESEQVARARGPAILWACLVEKPDVEVLARLARNEPLRSWSIRACFDEMRHDTEVQKLKRIQKRVEDRTNWDLRASNRHINLRWVGGDFIACERMSLTIKTATGSCSAPIWVPEPDWARRDEKTGIPIDHDEWSIDAFVRGPRPIVSLRRKNRDLEQDEEISEESNLIPEPSLAIDHPDYDHDPELIQVARLLRASPNAVETMYRRLEMIGRRGKAADRLLAHAILASRAGR